MKRYLIIAVIFLLSAAGLANAQRVGVKTNALYWATATPNVGFEFALSDRWTFELAGGYNPWTLNSEKNVKAKHFLVTPELRYWFCESFHGHFIGINANYTQFNISGMPMPNLFVNLCYTYIYISAIKNAHERQPQMGCIRKRRYGSGVATVEAPPGGTSRRQITKVM